MTNSQEAELRMIIGALHDMAEMNKQKSTEQRLKWLDFRVEILIESLKKENGHLPRTTG